LPWKDLEEKHILRRRIKMDIKKELSDNQKILIVLLDNLNSQDYVLSLIKTMKDVNKICYVTLYKSRNFLLDKFNKNNIDADKFYFVDCVSAYIKEPEPVKNTFFAPAPYELESIKRGINQAIEKGYSFVIFDSLSVLLNYGLSVPAGADLLVRFIRSFSDVLEKTKGSIIFLCNRKDTESGLIRESLVIFDTIIHTE
jgi:hypothetical protein